MNKREPDYYIIPNEISNVIDELSHLVRVQYDKKFSGLVKEHPLFKIDYKTASDEVKKMLSKTDLGYFHKALDKHSKILLYSDLAFKMSNKKRKEYSKVDKINYYFKKMFDSTSSPKQRSYAFKRICELW